MPGDPGGSLWAWESRCPRGSIGPSRAWGPRSSFGPWKSRWSHSPRRAGGARLPLPPGEPRGTFVAWVARGAGWAGQPRGAWGAWVPCRAGCSQLLDGLEGERREQGAVNVSRPLVPPQCPVPAGPTGDRPHGQCRHRPPCPPPQHPLPQPSPRSLIPWGGQWRQEGSWLPKHLVVPVAPVVPEDQGGPGAPGDLAAPGCPSSLSPQKAPAGLCLLGTPGHLSLPVGRKLEPGSRAHPLPRSS